MADMADIRTSQLFNDAKRSKSNCTETEWTEFVTEVATREHIDESYQWYLLFVLRKVEEDERPNQNNISGNSRARKNQIKCEETPTQGRSEGVSGKLKGILRNNVVKKGDEGSSLKGILRNNKEEGSKRGFGRDEGVERNVVKDENESSNRKGTSVNKRIKKNQVESEAPTLTGSKGVSGKPHGVQMQKVVNEQAEVSNLKSILRNSRGKKTQLDHEEQTQAGSKGVFGKSKGKIVQKQNVVEEEDQRANRKGISANNRAKKNQVKCELALKGGHKKLKGIVTDNNQEKECHNDSDSEVEIIELHKNVKEIHDDSDSDLKIIECYENVKESHDGSDSDLEILDAEAIIKAGYVGPFEPSKRDYMGFDETQLFGPSSFLDSEYKKLLLDALRKPFDKEEYNRHKEALDAGSYKEKYPDLALKLKRYRYNRGKRMTILRGFFFWLQHCSNEGSFRPWKDKECLLVNPFAY